MKSASVCSRQSSFHDSRAAWFDTDDDDEPTGQLRTLGSLVVAPLTAVSQAASVDEVRLLLCELRVPAIAVIDDDRAFRGVVTRTDVLRARDSAETTAGELMSRFVFALPITTPVERAAALMAFESVGHIIVTDDAGGAVGMVSALDIARYLAVREGYLAE